jgi:syringate O-demethylase
MKLMQKVVQGSIPDVKFFNMATVKIAGKTVSALRHGMVGQPGFEIFGPWNEGEAIKAAIVEAGQEFGLRLVGGRAYSSNTLESGWIPSPLPAIYTSPKMKAYREWLPDTCWEATASLGGSFYSENIEDYYLTPYDLGYGPSVKFDHDFVGREALEKIAQSPKRTKVTLALNTQDVMKAMGTMFEKGDRAKYFEFPSAVYATWPYDKVTKNGKTVGVSTWVGYSSNEGKMLTLAILDNDHAEVGNEVTFVWGEQPGTGSRPPVESHVQTEIRAIVCPVPYAEVAREAYRTT